MIHQTIDPGDLLPRRHGHVVGDTIAVGPAVFPAVSCEIQTMLLTILVVGFSPVLDKLFQQEFMPVIAYTAGVPDVLEKRREKFPK